MRNKIVLLISLLLVRSFCVSAQVWLPDNGDGTYTNPIIHADYSDPDVICVNDDYYMVASSFTCASGIPVLHSKDLVNWTIINHVYSGLPFDCYKYPAHGQGSWAPSIRYHNGVFYVYFCTPEEGLFVARTDDPAGGVSTGWQTVLRSKSIEGPYESRKVLKEGNGINGPHQGGLVDTQTGEWWFIHFQDKNAYGRIVHLQPARWVDDWPVIGLDEKGEGCGIPALRHKKPDVGVTCPVETPQTSDEFDGVSLGLQWQWQAMEQSQWYSLSASKGNIRLYAVSSPTEESNLYYSGNLLLQKLPAPEFSATAKMNISALQDGERAGIVMMGNYHTYLCARNQGGKKEIVLYEGKQETCGFPPKELEAVEHDAESLWLKVDVFPNATCRYSYSVNSLEYVPLDFTLKIDKGQWIGAKVGLFCITPDITDGKGFVDVDYFHVEGLTK